MTDFFPSFSHHRLQISKDLHRENNRRFWDLTRPRSCYIQIAPNARARMNAPSGRCIEVHVHARPQTRALNVRYLDN